MSRIEILRLSDEYRDACKAMKPLWTALLAAYPSSPERTERQRAFVEGQRTVANLRARLLATARGPINEMGE